MNRQPPTTTLDDERMPEPPPYEPDDALITYLEVGLTEY